MDDSKYGEILLTVQARIRRLGLRGMSSTSIVVFKVPTDRGKDMPSLPAILVAPFGRKRNVPITNLSQDITYPVLIVGLQAGNQEQSTNFDRPIRWLEIIEREFCANRLQEITSVWNCEVSPMETFDRSAFDRNLDAAGTILNFVSREKRRPQ